MRVSRGPCIKQIVAARQLTGCFARRWAGANAAPRTAPLDPAKAGNGAAPVAKTFTKVKTAAQLQKELDEALAKIARLEKKLADAGLSAE